MFEFMGAVHAGPPPLTWRLQMITKREANAATASQTPREFMIELSGALFGLHPTRRTPWIGHFEHDDWRRLPVTTKPID